jgi:hypothetical protein
MSKNIIPEFARDTCCKIWDKKTAVKKEGTSS